MGAIAVGLGIGLGLAAWSNRPTIIDSQPAAFVALILLGLFLAYKAGQSRGKGAVAVATAHARAESAATSQAVQAVNVYVPAGRRDEEEGERRGTIEAAGQWQALERAAWRGEPDYAAGLLEETDALEEALEEAVSHEYDN